MQHPHPEISDEWNIQMIDTTKLTLQDIGRRVIFSREGRTDEGTIFSFSREKIDVVYGERDHATMTRPEDLTFKEEIKDSRPYTPEEVRAAFLRQLKNYAKYWATIPDTTPLERCEGLVFSILVIFDGESELPAMDIKFLPHPTDKDYHRQRGENWYEEGMSLYDGEDTVCLHEEFSRMKET